MEQVILFKTNITDLSVTQDNQNAFTEAITKLISNSHLRKELGIHALETGDKYDKSNILKKWEDILTTIQHQLIL